MGDPAADGRRGLELPIIPAVGQAHAMGLPQHVERRQLPRREAVGAGRDAKPCGNGGVMVKPEA